LGRGVWGRSRNGKKAHLLAVLEEVGGGPLFSEPNGHPLGLLEPVSLLGATKNQKKTGSKRETDSTQLLYKTM